MKRKKKVAEKKPSSKVKSMRERILFAPAGACQKKCPLCTLGVRIGKDGARSAAFGDQAKERKKNKKYSPWYPHSVPPIAQKERRDKYVVK
jgi:hypothetical protein